MAARLRTDLDRPSPAVAGYAGYGPRRQAEWHQRRRQASGRSYAKSGTRAEHFALDLLSSKDDAGPCWSAASCDMSEACAVVRRWSVNCGASGIRNKASTPLNNYPRCNRGAGGC